MKNYEKMSVEEIKEFEDILIGKADNLWIEMYQKREGSNVDKLRLLSRQGRVQDKLQHDVIVNYFRKNGLASDGRTSLEDYVLQLKAKKLEFGKKIATLNDSYMKEIESSEAKIAELKESLKGVYETQRREFKAKKQTIIESQLQMYEEQSTQEIKNCKHEIDTLIDQRNIKLNELQDYYDKEAISQIEMTLKNQKNNFLESVEGFGAELEAELLILDSRKQDTELVKDYENEIKKLNQEMAIYSEKPSNKNPKRVKNLNDYTIAELKVMAEEKGITDIPVRIIKAELITMIEGVQ